MTAYLGQTPTPANANLDTLPQLPALLGALPANVVAALAAFNVVPVVASAAARDALIPAPNANQRVQRTDTGYQERFSAGAWHPEGVTRSAGPIVTTQSQVLVANGVADDGPTLAAADTLALASGGRHELDPLMAGQTKVFVNSNVTLTAPFRPIGKNLIYVAAGKTLSIQGPFDPAAYKVFDPTSPGTIDFSQNPYLEYFRPQWFGVTGLGFVDDSAALLFMTNVIPDFATVRFSRGMKMLLNFMWPILYRQGLAFIADTFPTDASQFTTNVIFKWGGVAGGTMIGNYNTGYCRFIGFGFDMQNAGVCIDTDMLEIGSTATSTAITTNRVGDNAAGLGCSMLTSLPINIPIKLSGAGPGTTLLVTTLTAAADGKHGTIGVAASTTFARSVLTVGVNAPTLSFRISTQTIYEYNQFIYGYNVATNTGYVGQTAVQIGLTSSNNCEYNVFRHNQFFGVGEQDFAIPQAGGAVGRPNFNGNPSFSYSAPGGQVVAGSNHFQGFSVDTFSAGMNSSVATPVQIIIGGAGATATGPRGGNAPLIAFAKYIGPRQLDLYSDAGLTIPVNATNTSPVGGHFYVGTKYGIGVRVGPQFNSKRHTFYENGYRVLNVGRQHDGGSCHGFMDNYSDNTINFVLGFNQSEPSSEYGTNSEDSGQHLQFGSPQPLAVQFSRFAMGFTLPGAGYFQFVSGQGAPEVRWIENQLENALPATGTVFMTLGQNVIMVAEGNRFADATTLPEIGWDNASFSNGSVVYSRCNLATNAGTILKAEAIYTNVQTGILNGSPQRVERGEMFSTNHHQPNDSDFVDPNSWVSWIDDARLWHRVARTDTTKITLGPVITGKVALTDAATVAVDLTLGDYLVAILTANRTIGSFAANWLQGQLVTFHIYNASGGAMTTTWNGIYHFLTPWVDPTNALANFVTFRVLDGVAYEVARGQSSGITIFPGGKVETATAYVDIAAAGSGTPNPPVAESYRYRIAGAATINAPLSAQDGMTFTMEIFNNTGGAITPTLNAIFLGTGYGAIGAAKSRTRRWQYDGNVAKWKPIGAVSEDF